MVGPRLPLYARRAIPRIQYHYVPHMKGSTAGYRDTGNRMGKRFRGKDKAEKDTFTIEQRVTLLENVKLMIGFAMAAILALIGKSSNDAESLREKLPAKGRDDQNKTENQGAQFKREFDSQEERMKEFVTSSLCQLKDEIRNECISNNSDTKAKSLPV